MTSGRNRRGVVYVSALGVVTLLALLAWAVTRYTVTQSSASKQTTSRMQAEYLALGMVQAVMHELQHSYGSGTLPELQLIRPGGERFGDYGVWLVGRDPLGEEVTWGLQPMNARLDINNGLPEMYARLEGMDEQIASAIVDWRDEDDSLTTSPGLGAEQSSYTGEEVPYRPKNALFESLPELLQVRGVDAALFWGEDLNRNGILDPGEDLDGDSALRSGLVDDMTIESRETALAPDGQPRVNVRDRQERLELMEEIFGAERTAEMDASLQQAAQTGEFQFGTRLSLLLMSDMSDDEMTAIWPWIRGDEGRLGLIDPYTASEEVLIAFGLDQNSARQIILSRPDVAPSHPLWLRDTLSDATIAEMAPFITTGAYQYLVDVVVVSDSGDRLTRLHAYVDLSVGVARLTALEWQDSLGWPGDPEALRGLQEGTLTLEDLFEL